MKPVILLVMAILVSFLVSCNLASSISSTPTPVPPVPPSLEFSEPTPAETLATSQNQTSCVLTEPSAGQSAQQTVLDQAFGVIQAIKNKDLVSLSRFVQPQIGLRFSPYAAVQDTHQVFTVDNLAGLSSDLTVYSWGAYSGTGASIELTFADYYTKFIYDADFANAPQEALNHRLGVSTTLDNTAQYYPGGMVVEFYFPGFDPNLNGMDWRSLRLVFVQQGNTWYLAAIIHDQWTI